ncbi:MAG: insulinase family protein [Chthonomonadetes bacterium]|nr:insulinase family protein [Chthonomonadetes bacterium]
MRRFLPIAILLCWMAAAVAVPPTGIEYPPLQYTLPKPERIVLPNGIVLYLLEDHDLPLVDVEVRLRGGRLYEPADRAGLSAVFVRAWRNGGTLTRSPDALNTAIEDMAAILDISDDGDTLGISLSLLARDWRRGLELLADLLRNPAFREEQVRLAKGQVTEQIRRRNDEIAGIASREFAGFVYGTNHPLGRVPTLQTVQSITRQHLLDWHRRLVTPRNIWIAVTGDFDRRAVLEELRRLFGGWKGGSPALPVIPAPKEQPAATGFIAKQADQAHLRIGHLGVAYGVPERAALDVLNYILGGSFTSRLTHEIRDKRGLAYAVWSSIAPANPRGLFSIGCQTKSESAEEVIQLIREQVRRLTEEPPSEEELQQAKESLVNSFVFRFPTASDAVSAQMLLEIHGLPRDTYDTYIARVQVVTAQDVLAAARKYIHPDRLRVLVVGDGKKLARLAGQAQRLQAR